MVPSKFEENLDKGRFQEAWQYAVETARRKAAEVAERMKVHCTLGAHAVCGMVWVHCKTLM